MTGRTTEAQMVVGKTNWLPEKQVTLLVPFAAYCLEKNNCESKKINIAFASVFSIITFLIPFVFIRPFKRFSINKQSITKLVNNKEFYLVLLAVIYTFINLVPKEVMNYRLYFTIPITLTILKESREINKALIFCYLSIYSLIIGGSWILKFGPQDSGVIDPRIMNIFFVFHFIFLITASLILFKESWQKTAKRIHTINTEITQ